MNSPPFESDQFTLETSQFLRIPLKRIGAVIGVGGSNKELIEDKTKTLIMIDSDTGEVEIRPNEDLKDPVLLFKARDIVKAIGRGFSVEQAIKLADDDYYLEVVRLKPIVGNRSNRLYRVRARLIGTKGRTKKSIEKLTKVDLVVSGATVSMIGKYEQISDSREAVMAIINGAKIESVIGQLEDHRKQAKREEEQLWESEEERKDIQDLIEETEEDPFEDYDT